MKHRNESPTGVQELCRKLKIQLDELSVTLDSEPELLLRSEERSRRIKLMEQLKKQLADLSR